MRVMKSVSAFLASDGFVAAFLAVITAIVGMAMQFVWQPEDHKGPPSGWHIVSVALASGQGFRNIEAKPGSPLEAFLYRQKTSLSRDEVPKPEGNIQADGFQKTHRYLFYLIGAVWWLFGISWRAVDIMLVVALSITSLALYGIFRLGMNRLFSLFGAFLFVSSPLMLTNLQVERDFLKAPFILGSILIMGYLAKNAVPKWHYIRLASALGLVMGIGLGFRQDLFICIFPATLALAVCRRDVPGWAIGQRCAAIAVMFATWFVAAFPILYVMHTGQSQSFHSMTGGIGCDRNLPVSLGSYELIQTYLDGELCQTYSSFTTRAMGDRPSLEFFSPDAERRARLFMLEAARTYPADFIARAYAASMHILGGDLGPWMNPALPSAPAAAVQNVRKVLSANWSDYRVFYVAAACLLLALAGWQTAWIAVLLVFFFCYTTSLQFQPRHVFHLCFLPLWLIGFTADKALLAAKSATLYILRRSWRENRLSAAPLARSVVFSLCVLASILLPLYAARAYQQKKLGSILPKYQNAKLEPVATERRPANLPGAVVFKPINWPQLDTESLAKRCEGTSQGSFNAYLQTQYVVAEFEADNTGFFAGPFYEAGKACPPSQPMVEVKVPNVQKPTRVKLFTPVYEMAPVSNNEMWTKFAGIWVPEKNADAFKSLYRVTNIEDFRLLPTLTLPEDVSLFRRYNTLVLDPPSTN